ncbi:MAG: hypothetical protein EBE86_011610 [Hormoscilla sp. GUM202]|nr:hypothetical protein [Hormoscilla sp. GUM202]
MTRTPHDRFAKDCLEELLKSLGQFQAPLEVKDEPRQIDAWFVPDPSSQAQRSRLGLLGSIVEKECLLEPVRAQLSPIEIRNCLRRQLIFYGELQRRAAREKREKRTLSESEFPMLWILCPTVSESVLSQFGAKEKEGWPEGVYFAPDGYKLAIVVINQLPATRETLWLRILGKGQVQQQAFKELSDLPKDEPLRKNILELVGMWYSNLQKKEATTSEEQELIMELSSAYLEWREATLQEGIERGQVQMKRQFIENFLLARFGAIDETLAATIEPLLKLSMTEVTNLMLELSSLERDEFLARLSSDPQGQLPESDNSM